MAISSAEQLHELIGQLGGQFRSSHHPSAHQLWSVADSHIEHALHEGGPWLTRSLEQLHEEWQTHKRLIQEAATWFEHHATQLATMAERPLQLSRNAIPGGGATLREGSEYAGTVFASLGIAERAWGLLHGDTTKDIKAFLRAEHLRPSSSWTKLFTSPYKPTAANPVGIGTAIDAAQVGYDVYTKGWGDGQTVEDTVDAVGGTVAATIAGPPGAVAWDVGAATGKYLGDQLENDYQIQEKSLSFIFGDPDNMTPAQAAQMVHDTSNPIAFSGAIWHRVFG